MPGRPRPTDQENEKLIEALNRIEAQTLVNYGIAKLSGSFATASVADWGSSTIQVGLKWGIRDGIADTVNTEGLELDRESMEIIVPDRNMETAACRPGR